MVKLTDQELLQRQQQESIVAPDALDVRVQKEQIQSQVEQELQFKEAPTLGTQIKSALLTGNVIAAPVNKNLQNMASHLSADEPADFDVIKELESRNAIHLFDSDIATAKSKDQLNSMLDFKLKVNDMQGDLSGLRGGTVNLITNIVSDPLTYVLPAAVGIKAGLRAGRVLKGAVTGAALAGGAGAIQNEILNRSIIGRRDQVSAAHVVAASAALGGVFGGIAGGLAPGSQALTRSAMAANLAGRKIRHKLDVKTGKFDMDDEVKSALAQSIQDPNNVDAATKAAMKVAIPYLTKSINTEILRSPFQKMVRFGTSLFDNPFETIGVKAGIVKKNAADIKLKAEIEVADSLNRRVTELYTQYAKRTKESGATPLTLSKFDDELFNAQLKGGEHNIPEVSAAAQIWNKHIESAIEDARKVGLDVGDVTKAGFRGTAARAWNVDAIIAERNAGKTDWIDLEADAIMAQNRRIRAEEARKLAPKIDSKVLNKKDIKVAKAEKVLAKFALEYKDKIKLVSPQAQHVFNATKVLEEFGTKSKIRLSPEQVARMEEANSIMTDFVSKNLHHLELSDARKAKLDEAKTVLSQKTKYSSKEMTPELTPEQARELAKNKMNYIIGHTRNQVSHHNLIGLVPGDDGLLTTKSDITRNRMPLMDDEAALKYLSREATAINSATYKTLKAQTIFKQNLIDNGYETIDDVRKAIRQEADDLIASGNTKKDWVRESEDAINKLDEYTEIFLGTYTKGDSAAFRAIRSYNTWTKLPAVLLSSLGDPIMNIINFGLKDTVQGYLKQAIRVFTDFKKLKLDARATSDLGITFQLLSNKVLKTFDDQDIPVSELGKRTDRFLGHAMDYFGIASAIAPWTNTHRFVAATISQAQIMRIIGQLEKKSFDDLASVDKSRLLRLGIDSEMATKILKESNRWKAKGEMGDFITNHHNWEPEAGKALELAIVKEVNETILMADKGDFSRASIGSGLGKLIFQFSSYGFAAQNKLLLKAINRPNLNLAYGIPLLIYINVLNYQLRTHLAGNKPSKDLKTLTFEGISRSGILGKTLDSLNAFNPYGTSSKYRDKDYLELFLGPTASTLNDTLQVGVKSLQVGLGVKDNKGKSIKYSEADANKIQGLIPGANLPYFKNQLNELFVKQLTGKPKRRNRKP